jgi:hypothetical protein
MSLLGTFYIQTIMWRILPIFLWGSDTTVLKMRITLHIVHFLSHDSCFVRVPSHLRKSRLRKFSAIITASCYLSLHPAHTLSAFTGSPISFFSLYTLKALEYQHKQFDEALCI